MTKAEVGECLVAGYGDLVPGPEGSPLSLDVAYLLIEGEEQKLSIDGEKFLAPVPTVAESDLGRFEQN
jgi:hypothetical protein